MAKRRIVLPTFGSLGDLHPYIAIALGLRSRGHEAILATSACYQKKIEALGLGFRPIRPDSDFATDPAVMRRFMAFRWGLLRVGRELLGPAMRQMYKDVLRAAMDADLLVSHPLTGYVTRLVAEKTGIPWASTMITPLGFLSAYDLPIICFAPTLCHAVRFLGPQCSVPLTWLFKRSTRFLAKPWYRLRAEVGLPPTSETNPLIDSHSPALVLALFSKVLADQQPDWPAKTVLTGFPVHDQDGEAALPAALSHFLEDGPPPLVFTLACSAATVAGSFFEYSVAAAKRLGRRAVLVTGRQACSLPSLLPDGVIACDYAPFSQLFPRAAAVVHPGGSGTTGLAMRAGIPMLVVPYAHEHPDNAYRAVRLGIARHLARHRYTPERAADELRHLLDDPAYAHRAAA
ncbi:MAG TPA: nucleotide disphospho-sugar-binding domain-containing protein, partial [Tepidisphaeraceae bacterium]|nr:nucleotide disphospho-sugar-binding domain-containing protein [Tepidisphaeraceae bacterium]